MNENSQLMAAKICELRYEIEYLRKLLERGTQLDVLVSYRKWINDAQLALERKIP